MHVCNTGSSTLTDRIRGVEGNNLSLFSLSLSALFVRKVRTQSDKGGKRTSLPSSFFFSFQCLHSVFSSSVILSCSSSSILLSPFLFFFLCSSFFLFSLSSASEENVTQWKLLLLFFPFNSCLNHELW